MASLLFCAKEFIVCQADETNRLPPSDDPQAQYADTGTSTDNQANHHQGNGLSSCQRNSKVNIAATAEASVPTAEVDMTRHIA